MKGLRRQARALWRLTMRTISNALTASPAARWQMATCLHQSKRTGGPTISYIRSEIIDLGRNKMWQCTECRQIWFLSELD